MSGGDLGLKHTPHEAIIAMIYALGEVQDAPAGHKITPVGVVFNMADDSLCFLFPG